MMVTGRDFFFFSFGLLLLYFSHRNNGVKDFCTARVARERLHATQSKSRTTPQRSVTSQ